MSLVRHECPIDGYGFLKMFSRFVEKIDVGWVFDIRRRDRGIHNQMSAVVICVITDFVRLQLNCRSAVAAGIIAIVVSVNISGVVRPLAGAEILVHIGDEIDRKTLAEVYHH